MRLLKFISEYWAALLGWLALAELINRCSDSPSNFILTAALALVAIGVLSALVVPKSG